VSTDDRESARQNVAWLMWCLGQGYSNPEDRAILTNWFGDDPATLTPEDAVTRVHLLEMADEVIADAAVAAGAQDMATVIRERDQAQREVVQLRRVIVDARQALGCQYPYAPHDKIVPEQP